MHSRERSNVQNVGRLGNINPAHRKELAKAVRNARQGHGFAYDGMRKIQSLMRAAVLSTNQRNLHTRGWTDAKGLRQAKSYLKVK